MTKRGAKRAKAPMVPIRVDRLRAAQNLDGRPWPEIARALRTTHPRLFHLTSGEGPAQRKCRRLLREGFANLFEVDEPWLAGETDALPYVVTADAAIVNIAPGTNWAALRLSLWRGAGTPSPIVQLALNRLLARTDAALRRDFERIPGDTLAALPELFEFESDQPRAYAVALVAQSIELGIELVRPMPPIGEAEAVRLSGIQHIARVLQPWFDGTGAKPDWNLLLDQFDVRHPDNGENTGLRIFMLGDRAKALVAIYDRLGGSDAA